MQPWEGASRRCERERGGGGQARRADRFRADFWKKAEVDQIVCTNHVLRADVLRWFWRAARGASSEREGGGGWHSSARRSARVQTAALCIAVQSAGGQAPVGRKARLVLFYGPPMRLCTMPLPCACLCTATTPASLSRGRRGRMGTASQGPP